MILKHCVLAWMAALVVLLAPTANAAVLNFSFTEDDKGYVTPDKNYIDVSIADFGSDIKFVIDVNTTNATGGSGFGLSDFSFAVADSINDISVNDLPDKWSLSSDTSIRSISFDYEVSGQGATEVLTHLEFTISGVAGDTVNDYNFGFGARLNKMDTVENGTKNVYFVAPAVTPVPLPAAFWLFGSAILGIAGFRRVQRRKSFSAAAA